MTMKIEVTNKKKNPAVEQFARDRFETAVGRFAKRIAHAEVHLADESAAKGSDEKVCAIDIKLNPRGHVHVRAKHSSVYTAIAKALRRAEAVIAKAAERNHTGNRVRHRFGAPKRMTVETAMEALN